MAHLSIRPTWKAIVECWDLVLQNELHSSRDSASIIWGRDQSRTNLGLHTHTYTHAALYVPIHMRTHINTPHTDTQTPHTRPCENLKIIPEGVDLFSFWINAPILFSDWIYSGHILYDYKTQKIILMKNNLSFLSMDNIKANKLIVIMVMI